MRAVDETIEYMEKYTVSALAIIAGLGFVGLGRLARVATVGMATVWFIEQIREIEQTRREKLDDMVDMELADSFPASDAPSYSSTTAGAAEEPKPEHLN